MTITWARLLVWLFAAACTAAEALDGEARIDNDIFGSGFDELSSVRHTTVDSNAYALWHTNTARHRSDVFVQHDGILYFAYYRADEQMIIARTSNTIEWELLDTGLSADAGDPHNTPNIGIDGNGLIHVIWGMHNDPIQYATIGPAGTTVSNFLTGTLESSVTYPSFYRLSDGDLLLLYRSGFSGRGDLIVKRYDSESRTWGEVASPSITGEGERNPYWQAYLTPDDQLHLSWNWQEGLPSNMGVESNHDLCYVRYSAVEDLWLDSMDNLRALPISGGSCDLMASVALNSGMANQTAIAALQGGAVFTASFWRPATGDAPQIHLVHNSPRNPQWVVSSLSDRPSVTGLDSLARPALLEVDGQLGVFQRDTVVGNRAYLDLVDTQALTPTRRIFLSSDDMGVWEPHATQFGGKIVVLMQVQNLRSDEGRNIHSTAPLSVGVVQ